MTTAVIQGIAKETFQIRTIDAQCDTCNLPFKNNIFEEIYTDATLEHISHKRQKLALQEFYRTLKPQGKLEIHVPDLLQICKEFIKAENSTQFNHDERMKRHREIIMYLYGAHDIPPPWHQTGFTETIITEDLQEAGFTNITTKTLTPDKSLCPFIYAYATKGN